MKFVLALLAGTALAVLPVAATGAPDPSQLPCTGVTATDPAKDETIAPTPLVADPNRRTGQDPNLDIRSVYFTYRKNEAGKMVLTGHIQVTNLSKNVPAEATPEGAATWDVDFNTTNGVSYLRARSDGEAVTFTYRKVETIGGAVAQNTEVATTGKFTEGPDGVVSIDWPADIPIAPGTKLEGVVGETSAANPLYYASAYFLMDTAPDDAVKTYTVTECPEQAATTTTDTNATTTQTTTQPQQQQPQQQQQQPGQQQQQGPPAPGQPLPATGTLTVDVAADKGKRKTAVKRGLRARVRCSVQCKVKATAKIDKRTARKLKLGGKAVTIAKGKASITKAGRIPFYVKLTKKAKAALKRKGVKKFALKVAFQVTDNQGKQVKKVTKKSTLR